jgi:hypothetical protein
VCIELRDGRQLRGSADAAPGSARYPLGAAAVKQKFLNLATRRVGPDVADELMKMIDGLEDLGELSPLWQLLASSAT